MFQMKKTGLCCVAQVIESRGNADAILHPVKTPSLKNLSESAKFLQSNKNLPITIVGDYDVDGIMATGIMKRGLALCGIPSRTRLPHRFSEGYGLSTKIIDEITEGIILTVDNGIAALDAIQKAKEKGLKVIVTDHHLPVSENGQRKLPAADVILDPWADDEAEYQEYCGAGLAYRFICELIDQCHISPYPQKELDELKTLAAIATVADLMNLSGANHTLVREGLALLNQNVTVPGIRVLCKKLKLEEKHITETEIGFQIGPALNAPGRLYDDGAERALDIIVAPPSDFQLSIKVEKLIQDNDTRKEMVQNALSSSIVTDVKEVPVVICNPEWGEGIIGLIAGQICEKKKCPAIIFTKTSSGLLKGSGRSIDGIHLKNVLDSISGLIVQYGGHAAAAGLSIKEEAFSAFRQSFIDACGPIPEEAEEKYDLSINSSNSLSATLNDLKAYAPYGIGNPRPVFRLPYNISEVRQSAKGDTFIAKGKSLDLVGFGYWNRYIDLGEPKQVEVIGYLSENWFNGKSQPTLEVIDLHDRKKRN